MGFCAWSFIVVMSRRRTDLHPYTGHFESTPREEVYLEFLFLPRLH